MDTVVKYYTPLEVAELLRVNAATVYRWLAAGKIPGAIKPNGGLWRIPAAALARMADGSDTPLLTVAQ